MYNSTNKQMLAMLLYGFELSSKGRVEQSSIWHPTWHRKKINDAREQTKKSKTKMLEDFTNMDLHLGLLMQQANRQQQVLLL
jgi:hypothetical protein